jgi:hypothetical protein
MCVTQHRADPVLGRVLVDESNEAIKWLAALGVRFYLSFNRQAYVDGRYKFWGGLCLKTEDSGKGPVQDHQKIARQQGVTILHSTSAMKLNLDPTSGAFASLLAVRGGKPMLIKAGAVVLAASGFEANPQLRSAYLGPSWDLAHV